MNFRFTLPFQKKAKKLFKNNPKLKDDLAKQLHFFQENPFHPSLKLHKLQGKRSSQYAIWIQSNLRAICIKDGDCYIFFDIIAHDEY